MRLPKLNYARLFCLALSCAGFAFVHERALAEVDPYEARVTTPRALVLSGPGEKFYPTGALAPGDIVEVYREEAGGWLGIRPPKGSFSLVSEKQLSSRSDDVAEISEDEVASRIGSQLSNQCNAIQVRLKQGEVVEVLGKESIGGEAWCKIAPPAGEFRWIHAASVERHGPISENTPPVDAESEVVPTSATSESDATKPAAQAPAINDEKWRASTAPAATAAPPDVVPPPLAPITPPAAPTATPASAPTPANSIPTTPTAGAPVAPTSPVGLDLPRQLTDIELRLSRMASSPPQLWNTERLQRDTEQLLAQAKTQPERDAVKVTMGKIDQFSALARRYQQLPAARAAAGQAITPIAGAAGAAALAGSQASGAAGSAIGAVAGAVPGDGRYDAVGVLRPVVSKRPGAPQFALVDERGQVVTFVTPSPDVNLQPYLGRRVGIAGNRGFIPEFNRAHVTAGRVTPLVR